MNDFDRFMTQKGFRGAGELTAFVCRFLDDPAIIYQMSPEEMARMEGQMDAALSLVRAEVRDAPVIP